MTKKDLLKKLDEFPDDAEIVYMDPGNDTSRVWYPTDIEIVQWNKEKKRIEIYA